MPKVPKEARMRDGVSPRVLNELFGAELHPLAESERIEEDAGEYIAKRLREVQDPNIMRKLLPPEQVGPREVFTKFGPWFEAQFGHRCSQVHNMVRYRKLQEKADDASAVARRHRNELNKLERAQRIHDAALKGWVAGYEAGRYEASKGKKT